MSSIITIDSEENLQNAEVLSKKIQDELYSVNKISEEIIEEISKIRKLTDPQSGILMKALLEAEESSTALRTAMPSSTPDSSSTEK